MTCHRADRLIEDVLNGDADVEAERELREHLGRCETCSEAWRTAWQVRSALNRCPASDPGDSYFRLVTARIIARVQSLAAEVEMKESAPAVGPLRYGPLQVRGVGLLFLMLLGCLLDGVALPTARAARAPGDPTVDLEPAPRLESAELPQPLPPVGAPDTSRPPSLSCRAKEGTPQRLRRPTCGAFPSSGRLGDRLLLSPV